MHASACALWLLLALFYAFVLSATFSPLHHAFSPCLVLALARSLALWRECLLMLLPYHPLSGCTTPVLTKLSQPRTIHSFSCATWPPPAFPMCTALRPCFSLGLHPAASHLCDMHTSLRKAKALFARGPVLAVRQPDDACLVGASMQWDGVGLLGSQAQVIIAGQQCRVGTLQSAGPQAGIRGILEHSIRTLVRGS